jgi:hypothetical protein
MEISVKNLTNLGVERYDEISFIKDIPLPNERLNSAWTEVGWFSLVCRSRVNGCRMISWAAI